MRSTDYISKGTAVARLYKAREYLLMDKDCRKGLCFYLRSVDILDYLEEIGIWNLDSFSIEVLWAYEDFINRGSIVALRNAKVVERRLNTLYSWRDSFDIRSSSKEIWGIARDSIFQFSSPPFLFLFQMLYFKYIKKQIKAEKHYVNQKNTSRRCRHDFKYF